MILYQLTSFACTYFSYAALHFIRSSWSFAKQHQQNTFKNNDKFLGIVDFLFLIVYSLSVIFLGFLGDRLNPKYLLFTALILTSIFFSVFPIVNLIFQNISARTEMIILGIFMALTGFSQFSGRPACLAIMRMWHGHKKTGIVMGLWGSCSNFGNIIGFYLSQIFLNSGLSWEYAQILMSGIALFSAFLLLFFVKIKENPKKQLIQKISINQPVQQQIQQKNNQTIKMIQKQKQVKQYNIINIFLVKGVAFYTIGYCFIKGCVYGVLFWIPKYFQNKQPQKHIGFIVSMIDFGQIAGGILIGILIDKFQKKGLFFVPFLVSCGVSFYVIQFISFKNQLTYFFLLFILGIALGGPYINIQSAIVIDLSKQDQIKGNAKAVATISSAVQGCGGIFTSCFLLIVPYFEQQLLLMFGSIMFLSSILFCPLLIKDVIQIKNKYFPKKK